MWAPSIGHGPGECLGPSVGWAERASVKAQAWLDLGSSLILDGLGLIEPYHPVLNPRAHMHKP